MEFHVKKSVISLLSYDAEYLIHSISTYYDYVDEIILGLDKDRISWSGNKFSFNEHEVYNALSKLDGDNKIRVIEDNFHRSDVPIENDNHERNFLKYHCSNDYILSFDADEELVNAKDFFHKYLPLAQDYDYDLMFTWWLPYKQIDGGYLFIADESGDRLHRKDIQGFTTKKINTYTYCRWTNNQRRLLSNLGILHWSFCRPAAQLSDKINNFGHSIESKKDPFYDTQKLITKDNYTQLHNFKTSGYGEQWPRLKFVPDNELTKTLQAESNTLI